MLFQTNLTIDWDMSAYYYTCYSPLSKYVPDFKIKPILECENIPEHYVVSMMLTILYFHNLYVRYVRVHLNDNILTSFTDSTVHMVVITFKN